MLIEKISFVENEQAKTRTSTILVDGIEYVIIAFDTEFRYEVYRNSVVVFPALAEKIIEAHHAETDRALNEMSDWVQAQAWYSD